MDGPNLGGEFTATVQLPEGDYRYKFVVDDQWIIDPETQSKRWMMAMQTA